MRDHLAQVEDVKNDLPAAHDVLRQVHAQRIRTPFFGLERERV